jgi:hypothetical protein
MPIDRLARGTAALTTHIERALERKELYLRGLSHADIAVAALFRRSVRHTRAIITLVKAGSGADAVALSRALIDCWIVLRWITNQDSEGRSRRFLGFEAKQKERAAEIGNKYPLSGSSTPFVLRPEIKRIAAEYPRWDSWGPGVRAMAEEPDILSPDSWLKVPPVSVHETLFFFASCYLHPTPTGLNHESLQGGSLFSFTRRHDEEPQAEFAVVATAAIIAHMGNRVSVFWGLGLSDEIADVWRKRIGRWLSSA